MPTLPELIDSFVNKEVPQMDDVAEAYAMCDAVSERFIRYCEAHGLTGLKRYTFNATKRDYYPVGIDQPNPAPDIYIVENDTGWLQNEAGYSMCSWHCIVDAGECLIDFTARQYQTSTHPMEFPLIIPMNRAMAAHA